MSSFGQTTRLLALFALIYFVQGIIEPTACLPYQPVQSQLTAWEFSTHEIGRFFGLIGIAWSIKPIFGVVSDFLPIGGQRRKPYLVISTLAVMVTFFALAAIPMTTDALASASGSGGWFRWLLGGNSGPGSVEWLGWLLIIVGVGVAMTDVAVDALAVETGQPRGLTGRIQGVQWTALSTAGILAGVGGGYVAQHELQRPMFAVCGVLAGVALVVILVFVAEAPTIATPRTALRRAWTELFSRAELLRLLAVAAFLFLWNFNPFSSNVLQHYTTQVLNISEQRFGYLLATQSLGMILASLAYSWYCRSIGFNWLIHGSIVAGILSTLAYWLIHDWSTAIVASFLFGLTWQTGFLVQLDLAARVCPLASAGTIFALLMSVTNSGQSAGIFVGGGWYDALTAYFGGNQHQAFHTLIAIAASFTAACWLLVPLLHRTDADASV